MTHAKNALVGATSPLVALLLTANREPLTYVTGMLAAGFGPGNYDEWQLPAPPA
jgi:hypothetical protein